MKLMAAFAVALPVMMVSMTAPEQACAQESGVPLPSVPKAVKGEQCVEPVDVMRREHMNFLIHQRDETMRQGIRGNKYSLKGCTECHATVDPAAKDKKVRTVEPFCAQCHEYAAVKIDCFECHNPELPLQQNSAASKIPENDTAGLQQMIVSHLSAGVFAGLVPEKKQKEYSQ